MDKSAQKSPSLGIAQSLALSMLLALGTVQITEPSAAVPPITYNDQVCDLPTGAGTSANPYIISTADELWEATDCSRVAGAPAYLELANDIDVSVAANAPTNSPIGFSTSALVYTFSGILDGKGYQISGISMSRADGVGLFGYLSGATLKNFSIAGSFTSSSTLDSDNNSSGALARRATNSVTIDSITNSASVRGGWRVGGLVGFYGRNVGLSDGATTLQILNSVNQGTIRASGNYLGGLIGRSGETTVISNSGNIGTVSVTGLSSYVGGLIGWKDQQSTTITNAYNSGNVTGHLYVGGLIGLQNSPTTITGSSNSGIVSGSKIVGGLVGSGYRINIVQSSNVGDIKARTDSTYGYAGGLVGEVTTNGGNYHVSQSFNSGNVSGYQYVGGLLGNDNASGGTITLMDSYNSGQITGTVRVGGIIGSSRAVNTLNRTLNSGAVSGTSFIDGLVGENTPSIVSSYALTTSRLVSTSSLAELRQASTFTGWNFTSIWGFGECSERNGLPLLRFAQEVATFYSSGCLETSPQPHVADRTWENWHSSSPHLVMAFSATPGEAFSVTIPISGVTAGGSVKIQDDEFYQITTSAITLTDNLTVTLDAGSVSSSTIHIQIEGTNVATTLGTNPNPDSWKTSLKGILSWGNIGLVTISKAIFGATVTELPNALPTGVTDLSEFFFGQSVFNSDLSGWDVSDVTQMPGMFRGATVFNQDISSWDVSSVVNMAYMFVDANEFNQPIGSWDIRSVTNFNLMFYRAPKFNQPLAAWDMTNGLDLSSMFEEATSFNQPLRNWTVSNAVNLNDIFKNATSFNQTLDWRPQSATSLRDMFLNSAMTCRNYESFLVSAEPALSSGASGTIGGGKYTSDALEVRAAIAAKGWTLSDSPCVDFPSLSPSSFAASAGDNVTFTQSYSGAAASFSITPTLPTGLSLNPSDGAITGNVANAFSGSFFLIATNREGSSSATISIAITTQPRQDQSTPDQPSVRSIKIPKFNNLNKLEVEANATTSVQLFGEDLQLIRSLELGNRELTFSLISSQEIRITFSPTPNGIYDLRLELTAGTMTIGSAFLFKPTQPKLVFSSSQLVVRADRFASKLSESAKRAISSWNPGGRFITCLAYNDRPGINPRRKAISRAAQACAAYSGTATIRVEVFRGNSKLASSVKLISR